MSVALEEDAPKLQVKEIEKGEIVEDVAAEAEDEHSEDEAPARDAKAVAAQATTTKVDREKVRFCVLTTSHV